MDMDGKRRKLFAFEKVQMFCAEDAAEEDVRPPVYVFMGTARDKYYFRPPARGRAKFGNTYEVSLRRHGEMFCCCRECRTADANNAVRAASGFVAIEEHPEATHSAQLQTVADNAWGVVRIVLPDVVPSKIP